MAEYYFSAKTDMETTLCIAPITDKRIELSGEEIEDRSGYFLYQIKGDGEANEIEILARLTSESAAIELSRMLSLK